MKTPIYIVIFILLFASCAQDDFLDTEKKNAIETLAVPETNHLNAARYQEILDQNQKDNLVGVSVMIKDKHGVWTGTAGKADIENNIDFEPGHRFFIASVTKVFTASLIYLLKEESKLSLDDKVADWIDADILDGLANADEAQIKHLLSHTSGIPDYYSMDFDMKRMNVTHNHFTHEDLLNHAKPFKANNKVGESYWYCNTNYVLLGMIIEKVTGSKLYQVYDQYIFEPLNLKSGYYVGDRALPDGAVNGYVDMYGDGKWINSQFLFQEELNTADGGIAINAYEVGLFFEKLMKGDLIGSESLEQMTNWFAVPDGWWDPSYYDMEAGYGIEKYKTPYGNSVGHSGSIMGFESRVEYFPELDATIVVLVNCSRYDAEAKVNIYHSCLEVMFDK